MQLSFFKKKRIHLDYASTTPIHPRVYEAMRPHLTTHWANPSALYREAVSERAVIERARKDVAELFQVRPEGVTFVSGGTEANNLGLRGLVSVLHKEGRAYADMEVISTKIEHPSILETLAHLESHGVQISYVAVTSDGLIDREDLKKKLTAKTVLVTFAYVNSEIGVVQDVKAITRVIRKWNEEKGVRVYTHIDASQAPLWLPCELPRLGVDLMTLDAGKCYGPKGVGALLRTHGVPLLPIIYGGGQEGGIRSGTESVALILGCAMALRFAQEGYEIRSKRVLALRDYFMKEIEKHIPGMVLNGSRTSRVANNVNISIPGSESEYAVIWLDKEGIACATKSACGVHGKDGSKVVRILTGDDARARGTIRFTLGEETKESDLDYVISRTKFFLREIAGVV